MKMCELSLREREFLDEVNQVNRKYEENPVQSLWNVCWGYLNGTFNMSLLSLPDNEIKDTLRLTNEKAPKVPGYGMEVKKSKSSALF